MGPADTASELAKESAVQRTKIAGYRPVAGSPGGDARWRRLDHRDGTLKAHIKNGSAEGQKETPERRRRLRGQSAVGKDCPIRLAA